MMNPKNRLAGRFLPSRVYARWTWTVRFGLCALPLILFLAGGVTYYLAPSRYQSTVVFEYTGKRTPAEAAGLLKTRNVIFPTVEALDLTKHFEIDKETASRIVSESTEIDINSESGVIELTSTNIEKEVACTIAAELPKALDTYERLLATRAINVRLQAAEKAMTDAEDETNLKRQALLRLIAVRGDQPADPVARIDLDAARVDWEHSYRQVLENQTRVADAKRELAGLGEWVVIHSQPSISQSPVGKKPDESLGAIILQALGAGLTFALLAPYLLELACPRRTGRKAREKNAWPEFADDPEVVGS